MRTFPSAYALSAFLALAVSAARTEAAEKDLVETAQSAGSFNTLVTALQAADLVDALRSDGPLTVFAPTDEAFSKLPKGTLESLLKPENKKKLAGILTYHVVKGRVPASQVIKRSGLQTLNGQQIDVQVDGNTVKVDNAKVVKTDIAASNGLIHVIDQVILPAQETIPALAAKSGNFDTLVAAVKAAGLADALSGDGPFTVFAPTDEAFAELPKGTLESLLKPENKGRLAEILKYHVVKGRVYSGEALAAGVAKTLQGASLTISKSGSGAKVNNAQLVATDLDASNGVIHVIDSVILPPENRQSSVTPESKQSSMNRRLVASSSVSCQAGRSREALNTAYHATPSVR